MTIIDAHVHKYADEVLKDSKKWAEDNNELYWMQLVCSRGEHKSIQGWASTEKFIQDMNDARVDKALLLGWYWENQKTCNLQNDWHAKWINEHSDRFIAFASVQPLEGDSALDDLKRALDKGLKGVGEIFPAAQGFEIKNKTWLKIVEFCVTNDLPINMHVSDPVAGNYHGKVNEPLSDYFWLAKEYPELKLILAHWGGLMLFYELNPEAKEVLKNVYYDTAAGPLLYNKKLFFSALEVVGSKKLIFGSDYPLRLYPSRHKEAEMKTFLHEIKGLNLSQEVLGDILGNNLKKLLKL